MVARGFILIATILIFAHANEFEEVLVNRNNFRENPRVNEKFKNKATKYFEDSLSPKSDALTDRERWFLSLRVPKNESIETFDITGRYLLAQQQLDNLHVHKLRRLDNIIQNFVSIGPSSNQPDGGRTRALLVQGTAAPYTLFAGGVSGGIWKSTNSGTSWTVVYDLLPNLIITCFAAPPQTNPSTVIYAGTGEGYYNLDARRGAGIYKSTDSGATWNLLPSTQNADFYYVNKIAISSLNANTLYVATRSGLFKSTDAGATFTEIMNALSSGGFFDVVVFTSAATDRVYTWAAGFGLYVSVDAGMLEALVVTLTGATFTRRLGVSTFSTTWWRGSIAVAPNNLARAYTTVSPFTGVIGGIYRTDDSGNTWTNVLNLANTAAGRLNQMLVTNAYFGYDRGNGLTCAGSPPSLISQGWYDNILAVDPTNSSRVFVGGIDLFRSDDAGVNFGLISTWWSSTVGKYLHADQHAIVFSPNFANDRTVFVGNDGGVARTVNPFNAVSTNPCTEGHLVTWAQLNIGYTTLQFYHGSVSATGTTYVGGTQDNGSWKWLTGTQWTDVNGGDGGFTAVDNGSATRFYTSYVYTTIYRHDTGTAANTDILSSGQLSGGDGSFINPFIIDNNNPAVIYTCNDIVWRTTNARATTVTWSSLGNLNPTGTGTEPTALALTSDSATLVTPPAAPVKIAASFPGSISSIVVSPQSNSIVFVTISEFGVSHLWKSTNGGVSFTSLTPTGLPDIPALCLFVHPENPQILYLGTDLGIFYSEDGGVSVTQINNYGFANVPTQWFSYQASTKTLFVWTHGRGVFKHNATLVAMPPTGVATTGGVPPVTTGAGQTGSVTTGAIYCVIGGTDCPANSECIANVCVCNVGYALQGSQCVVYEESVASSLMIGVISVLIALLM